MDPRGERLCAQLREAVQRLAEWRRLDDELRAVDTELARHDAHDDRVRRRAGRVANELERVRGFGFRSLLLRVTGRAARLIAEGEARLAEARAEQQSCESAMEPLRQRRAAIVAQQAPVAGAPSEHAELLAAKEQWLRGSRHAALAQLDALRERLDVVAHNRAALAAALGAARLAAGAVQDAIDHVWRARAPGRLPGTNIAFDLAVNRLESRSRAAQADAHVAHAMLSVQSFTDVVRKVRELGVVDLDDAAGSFDLFETGAEVELAQVLARVREIAWTCERSDQALAELHATLCAERAACIEAAQ